MFLLYYIFVIKSNFLDNLCLVYVYQVVIDKFPSSVFFFASAKNLQSLSWTVDIIQSRYSRPRNCVAYP